MYNDLDSFHERIHNGVAFLANDWYAISGAGTREIMIEPPAEPNESNMKMSFVGNGSFTVTVYENTSKTTGTAIIALNRKRMSTRVAETVFSHTPGGSGNGSQIYKFTAGVSNQPAVSNLGGGLETYHEIHLKPNIPYLVVISGTDVTVTSMFDWYETIGSGAMWMFAKGFELDGGSVDSGTIEDTKVADGVGLVIAEAAGSEAFDLDLLFGTIPAEVPAVRVNMKANYDGTPGHNVKLKVLDPATETYDNVTGATTDFPDSSTIESYTFNVKDDKYIASGQMTLKVDHTSSGNAGDKFTVDRISLQAITVTTTTSTTTTTTTTATISGTTTTTCQPANRLLIIQSNHADASTDFKDNFFNTVTAGGNVQHDTADARWCSSGILFDGDGDYLQVADNADWDMGTGNFTIEFWVKLITTGQVQCLCMRGDDGDVADTSWKIWATASNTISAWISNGSSSYQVDDTTNIAAQGSNDYWWHVALVRATNTLEIRVTGIRGDTADVTGVTMLASDYPIYYGIEGSGGLEDFNGWLDELLISNVARWSGPFPDGPPTGPECSLC